MIYVSLTPLFFVSLWEFFSTFEQRTEAPARERKWAAVTMAACVVVMAMAFTSWTTTLQEVTPRLLAILEDTEWIRRHYPVVRVHAVNFPGDPYPIHIDATFTPIRPGLMGSTRTAETTTPSPSFALPSRLPFLLPFLFPNITTTIFPFAFPISTEMNVYVHTCMSELRIIQFNK